MTTSRGISRRAFLRGAAAVPVGTGVPGVIPRAGRRRAQARENSRRAGDDDAGREPHIHAHQSHIRCRRLSASPRRTAARRRRQGAGAVAQAVAGRQGSARDRQALHAMGEGTRDLSGTRTDGSAHNLMRAVSGIEMALWDLAGQDPRRADIDAARRKVPRQGARLRSRGAAQHAGQGVRAAEWAAKVKAHPSGFTCHKFGFPQQRSRRQTKRATRPIACSRPKSSSTCGRGSRTAARPSAGITTSWSTAIGSTTCAPRSRLPMRWSRSSRCGWRIRCRWTTRIRGSGCARASKVPICMGENLARREGFKDFILNQGCDILHPDLRNSGGFLETKRIADMAHVYGLPMANHNTGSQVHTYAAVQWAASIRDLHRRSKRSPATAAGWTGVAARRPVHQGRIRRRSPTGPGLGSS